MINVFGAESFTLTTTPAKVVSANDFDRTVTVHEYGGADAVISFTNAAGGFVLGSNTTERFVLPADEELWGSMGSGTTTVSILVSK